MNIALLAGIVFGSLAVGAPYLLYIIGAFGAAVFLVFKRQSFVLVIALLCSFCVGGALFLLSKQSITLAHESQIQEREIIGEVIRASNRDVLIQTDKERTVEVTSLFTSVLVGQRVQVLCEQYAAQTDLSRYASQRVIATCYKSKVIIKRESIHIPRQERYRLALVDRIQNSIPQPEAGLLAGILIGDQATLPGDVLEGLRATATAHIVVLSGYNITIVALFIGLVISRLRLSLRFRNTLSIVGIWFFVLFTGFGASSIRAACMVSFVLVAKSIGRPFAPLASAIYAASVICILSPELLLYSISFQLTFAATIGMLYASRISPSFHFVPWKFLQDVLRTTWAACVMTFPITAYYFHSLSLIGIVANCLIVPLIPFCMGLGAAVVVLSFVHFSFSVVVGFIPYLFLRWIFFCIDTLRHIPFATLSINPSLWILVGIYMSIALVIWLRRKIAQNEAHEVPVSRWIKIIAVVTALSSIVLFVFYPQTDIVRVSFFDVGQGDASHIRLANGFDILIDGGPDATVVSRLGHDMPYWDRTIELLIITHPHADHVTGLIDVLKKYHVNEIWISGQGTPDVSYTEVVREIQLKKIPVAVVFQGAKKQISASPSISLNVLWPEQEAMIEDANDSSLVTELDVAHHSFLFTGDASSHVEEKLLADKEIQDVDVLKVGHHGSNDASGESFVQIAQPEIAVISVGKNNMYHHPSPSTLSRLKKINAIILRTDICSTVSLAIKRGFGLHIVASCPLDKS